MSIVLASASPRRKELLEMLGVSDLKVIPATGEETAPEGAGPEEMVIATLSANQLYERAEQESIVSCIACGSCQFTCPSHRPILDNILLGKAKVMEIIKNRNKK